MTTLVLTLYVLWKQSWESVADALMTYTVSLSLIFLVDKAFPREERLMTALMQDFSWGRVLETDSIALAALPFAALAVLLGKVYSNSKNPMTAEEAEWYAAEDAEFRAQLQDYANLKAIEYYNTHRKD